MSKPGIRSTPEKSNFAQTCNLLSQYLKEKGNLGDLGLGITRKPEPKERSLPTAITKDLLTKMESSTDASRLMNAVAPSNAPQPMDFLPQLGCFCSPNSIDVAANKADFRIPAIKEPVTIAPMTIFYAGQVLVLNDFPADKAREIIALASKGSSINISSGFVSASGMDKVNSGRSMAPESTVEATSEKNTTNERLQQRPDHGIASDLPIARRASLHRFFEKRKDRVAAKAPYQVNPLPRALPKAEESNTWIVLEDESSKQLELKL